ncbi:MAG: type II CAAX endopeptidase family protein [Planctomycetota bacterium]|nr:type II CAAX endopeptidase family protein [Planctomycetota bacterium]
MDMILLDHIIVLFIAVLVPLNQYLGRGQLRAMIDYNCAQRINVYWNMIVVQWIMMFLLLSFWAWQGRSLALLGFTASFGLGFWISAGVAILGIIGLGLYYRSQLNDDQKRENLRQLADQLAPFLPRTKPALKRFNILCITAGIIEEFIFRGFFIWYATRFLGESIGGLVVSVFLTSAIFMMGHLYQGRRGMSTVFIVGLLYGGVYILGGSLWVPMVMHAIMDLMGGHMALLLHPEGEVAIPKAEPEYQDRKAA